MEDDQPSRVIGRRSLGGVTPGTISKESMDWMDSMNRYETRVPKGVFRYKTMEDANADMEQWLAMTMVQGHEPRQDERTD